MKKLLSIIAALLICMGTQAQIVSSRSSIVRTESQPSYTQWFVRGGMNIMSVSGDGAEGTNSKMGYNVMVGFSKPGNCWCLLGNGLWSDLQRI